MTKKRRTKKKPKTNAPDQEGVPELEEGPFLKKAVLGRLPKTSREPKGEMRKNNQFPGWENGVPGKGRRAVPQRRPPLVRSSKTQAKGSKGGDGEK